MTNYFQTLQTKFSVGFTAREPVHCATARALNANRCDYSSIETVGLGSNFDADSMLVPDATVNPVFSMR